MLNAWLHVRVINFRSIIIIIIIIIIIMRRAFSLHTRIRAVEFGFKNLGFFRFLKTKKTQKPNLFF